MKVLEYLKCIKTTYYYNFSTTEGYLVWFLKQVDDEPDARVTSAYIENPHINFQSKL